MTHAEKAADAMRDREIAVFHLHRRTTSVANGA